MPNQKLTHPYSSLRDFESNICMKQRFHYPSLDEIESEKRKSQGGNWAVTTRSTRLEIFREISLFYTISREEGVRDSFSPSNLPILTQGYVCFGLRVHFLVRGAAGRQVYPTHSLAVTG